MVPKPAGQRAETSEETRRGGHEGERRPRIAATRTASPRHHASSSADDERNDAPPSLPSPRGAPGRPRTSSPGRASSTLTVTARL